MSCFSELCPGGFLNFSELSAFLAFVNSHAHIFRNRYVCYSWSLFPWEHISTLTVFSVVAYTSCRQSFKFETYFHNHIWWIQTHARTACFRSFIVSGFSVLEDVSF
jgi:hypothetical protein